MDDAELQEILADDHVSLAEPPAEKTACIEYLLDLLVDAGRVTDREQALADLMERESQTTTGVGHGVGIPHAKTAGVDEPSVAFTRSSEGVDFGAMDGEPATLVFMILVPEDAGERHLSILSSLSRALVHDETRESLHETESPADVRAALGEVVA
ncbi:PTS sugar transporter subunit IIA [Halobacterium zhouii]|uniref:PTS sugar transporter subunit IIA n=1 Tax=Halobacterium zhouii TaxID=2902624 RepID=UPI001E4B7051|nr:fructose PTS transporter subunit IIA [Halobacterium zhouii]